MFSKTLVYRFVPTVVALFVSVITLAAAEKANGPVGLARSGGSFIEWQLLADGERVLLTISGPDGKVYSREFAGRTNPSFRVQELGKGAMDGVYKYELRVVPKISGDLRARLAAARVSGDEEQARRIQREAGLGETVVQSGGFRVLNGVVVAPDTPENAGSGALRSETTVAGAKTLKPVLNDQVIPDDLIVQGSACVGLDCVLNESFGFDTIRLKENNLRIKFEDTSLAGFPTQDWQITANDSAAGGLDKFSIDDVTGARTPFTIEGNATTNSIYVASTGRVGFRTSTPVLDLHVRTGNTPAHRLEQDSTGGFTAQTWDVAGNEANFFVRDVTGGSRLPFRIRPGAPTSSIDINASGFVGIGTAGPQKKLHIVGAAGPVLTFPSAALGAADSLVVENNGNVNVSLVSSATGNATFRFVRDSAPAQNGWITYVHSLDTMSLGTNGAERLRIDNQGRIGLIGIIPTHAIQHPNGAHLTLGGQWITGSSRDWKQQIEALDAGEAMKAFSLLDPVKYVYTRDPNEHHVGFIAEDVPDLVATGDRKGLSALDIVAVLTKVVQEQQKTIEKLERRLEQLEKHE